MSYETKNPNGAKELVDGEDGWSVLDVRTVEEFDEGHIPGAFNVPFAFAGMLGMEPNSVFVDTVRRLFPSDSKLVLV